MNNYPISRHDPGELPEPPKDFTISAACWWWKLAAWAKVRCKHVQVTMQRLEDVSLLMARWEREKDERSREVTLMNVSIQLAECGFCSVDLEHLDIPEHEIFADHRRVVNERKMKVKPEHLLDMSKWETKP